MMNDKNPMVLSKFYLITSNIEPVAHDRQRFIIFIKI
jgi:hypothetical protein